MNQKLEVTVALVLTDDSVVNAEPRVYSIASDAELSVINGNATTAGSFLYFLNSANGSVDGGIFNADGSAFGPNLTSVRVSFDFKYVRAVLDPRTREVPIQTQTYGVTGTILENTASGKMVQGVDNLLTDLGISAVTPDDAEEQGYPDGFIPTIYYQLASAPGDAAASCVQRYAVDNQDNSIRVSAEVGERLNYEEGGRSNACVLQASLNGVGYENVTTGDLSAADLENVDSLSGTASVGVNMSCTNSVAVASDLETCHYDAAVDIDLTDVNEAPVLTLSADESTTPEGDVGTAVVLDGEVISGGDPADVMAADRVLANVTYGDADAADNPSPTSDMPEILVSPRLPDAAENLFYLEAVSAAGETALILMLNSSALSGVNFESLTADEAGRRGYRVTLRAADNRSADLTADASFMLAVTDVVYKPVQFEYRSDRVVNTTTGIQNLLPGFAQFIDEGGPILGTVTAIDPESGSSDGIVYEYNPAADGAVGLHMAALASFANFPELAQPALIGGVVGQIAPNFVLNDDRLSLLGLGLRPLPDYAAALLPAEVALPPDLAYDFTITLNAYNSAAERTAGNATTLAIKTKVAYNVNSTLGFGGKPAVRFPSGLYAGAVPEGVPGGPGVSVLDALTLQTEQPSPLQLGTPNFYSLVQLADLFPLIGSLPPEIRQVLSGFFIGADARFDLSGTDNFDINSSTGQLYLADTVTEGLNFGLFPFHTLLVRTAASADPGLLAVSDYAVVLVTVLDTNTAPQITGFTAAEDINVIFNADTGAVSANIPESVPPGTVLARFTLTDDNPFIPMPGSLNVAGESNFRVQPTGAAPVRDDTTGIFSAPYEVVLAQPLDYENANARVLSEGYNLTDAGSYRFDLQRYMLDPNDGLVPLGTDIKSVTLEVNAEVQNVNEPIELRVTDAPTLSVESLSEIFVAESAAEETVVAYVHLLDPENGVNATNVPTAEILPETSPLQGALRLVFDASGTSPYYRLEVADAVILENAGDGRTFELTVTVTENATDVEPVSVSFDLQITNENQDILDLASIGVTLDGVSVSEQQGLNAAGGDVAARLLVAELFNLTDIHPDYDETFPGTEVRLVDLDAEVRSIGYATDVTDALEQEEDFGLFELSVTNNPAGTVSLLLKEGKLIDPALIGSDLALSLEAFDPNGASAAGIASMDVGTLPVAVEPTDSDEIIFGDALGNNLRTPAAYTFEYTQSDYAEVVAGVSSCPGGDDAGANLNETINIDGNCYPTVAVDMPGGERRYVVERDRSNQRYYGLSEDLNAVLNTDDPSGSFGVILTDADVNVSDLGVYQLNADGVLEEAADAFDNYFTLVANNSYAVSADGSDARPALVISQNVLAELNSSSLPSGEDYLSLDTLNLNIEDQTRTLTYFVVAGAAGTDGNNASRRAIAQINFEVTAAGLNEPAFLSELTIGGVSFSNESVTEISANQFEDAIGAAAANILSYTVMNPDGNGANNDGERRQIVKVLLEVMPAPGVTNSQLSISRGDARGTALIRLGVSLFDSNANITGEIASGVTEREFSAQPFRLARNVWGEAVIKATIREYLEEDGIRGQQINMGAEAEIYHIRVAQPTNSPPTVDSVELVVGERVALSPVSENDDDLIGDSLTFRFDVSDADFASPRNQVLSAAVISLDGMTVFDSNSAVRTITDAGANGQATVTYSGLVHNNHSFGGTDFSVVLTEREPRGFSTGVHNYDSRDAQTQTFVVTSANDDLISCADDSPDREFCGGRANTPATFVLATAFDDGASETTATAAMPLTIFLQDDDLTFPASSGEADLPSLTTDLGDLTPAALAANGSFVFEFDVGSITNGTPAIVAAGDGDQGGIKVTVPVTVRLTPEQYDMINILDGGADVAFDIAFADGGNNSVTRTAAARISFAVNTTGLEVSEPDLADGLTVLESAGKDDLLADFSLTDNDIRRPSGDTLTYTVTAVRDGATEDSRILGWYIDRDNRIQAPEVLGNSPVATITRSLGFARDPDDADVGEYTVSWNITDAKNPAEGAVQEGTFQLEITDVYEEPVFSVANFVAMAKENGVTGLERNTLAALLGENSRFSVQWDQWNLPGAMANPYRLKLEYRLAVTAGSNKGNLYRTYPEGIIGGTPVELFGLVSDALSVTDTQDIGFLSMTDAPAGDRRFRTVDIMNPGTGANEDTVIFNLTAIELRASDYNEGTTHNLTVLPVTSNATVTNVVLEDRMETLAAVTYADKLDPATVSEITIKKNIEPAGTSGTSIETNDPKEALNTLSFRLQTADIWTGLASTVGQYIARINATGAAGTGNTAGLTTPFEIAELLGVYVDASTSTLSNTPIPVETDLSKADPGSSMLIAFDVWVGDKQVNLDYGIEIVRTPDGVSSSTSVLAANIQREDDAPVLVSVEVERVNSQPSQFRVLYTVEDNDTLEHPGHTLTARFIAQSDILLLEAGTTTGGCKITVNDEVLERSATTPANNIRQTFGITLDAATCENPLPDGAYDVATDGRMRLGLDNADNNALDESDTGTIGNFEGMRPTLNYDVDQPGTITAPDGQTLTFGEGTSTSGNATGNRNILGSEFWTITDADFADGGTDDYRYTLRVTDAANEAVTDLFRWVNVSNTGVLATDEIALDRNVFESATSDNTTRRTIAFAKTPEDADIGTYEVTATITDLGGGTSNSSTYTVVIVNVDEAPDITAPGNQDLTFSEGTSTSGNATGNRNILGSAFWTITDEDFANEGTDNYGYTLTVRRNGNVISELFQWVNTSDEGDAGEVTYLGDVDESATGGTTIRRTIAFARTPEDADIGTYQVEATIADTDAVGDGDMQTRTYTVEIVNVNEVPTTFTAVASRNPSFPEGSAGDILGSDVWEIIDPDFTGGRTDTYRYTLTVNGDPLGADPLFQWVNVDLDTAALSTVGITLNTNIPESATRDNTIRRTIAFARSPDDADIRTHTVVASITDVGSGATRTGAYTVTITNVDEAPTITAPVGQTLTFGEGTSGNSTENGGNILGSDFWEITDTDFAGGRTDNYRYTLDVMGGPSDAAPLFRWVNVSNTGVLATESITLGAVTEFAVSGTSINRTIAFARTPEDADIGTYVVEAAITDTGNEATETRTYTVKIVNVDEVPDITAPVGQTLTFGEGTSGNSTENGGNILGSDFWEITDTDFAGGRTDDYQYTLVVTDAANEPVTDLFRWANSSAEGDADETTYSGAEIESASDGTTIRRTIAFTRIPGDADIGTYTITANITDVGTGTSEQVVYTVEIVNVDEAPIITAQDSVPTLTFDEGASGNILISLHVDSSDYRSSWQITDEDLTNDREDTYRYTLTVTRDLASVTDLFEWVNVDSDTGVLSTDGIRLGEDILESAVNGSASFNRTIAFARTPDDADVGTYEVVATITDVGATATDPESSVTTSRTYTVVIRDVEEAPVITAQDSVSTLTFNEGESGNILNSLAGDNQFWQITDEDLTNGRTDTYQYALDVTRTVGGSLSADPLFEWVDVTNGVLATDGIALDTDITVSASINRTIAFARTPDDADVGTYMVVATITDVAASVTTSRTYTVEIRNVYEAPVVVVQGASIERAVTVNGDDVTTALNGATIEWEEWDLPDDGVARTLTANIRVTVTPLVGNLARNLLSETHPDDATFADVRQELLNGTRVIPTGGGDGSTPGGVANAYADYEVSLTRSGNQTTLPADLLLRASDYNENTRHVVTFEVVPQVGGVIQAGITEGLPTHNIAYPENFDPVTAENSGFLVPDILIESGGLDPDNSAAHNTLTFWMVTPDIYTNESLSFSDEDSLERYVQGIGVVPLYNGVSPDDLHDVLNVGDIARVGNADLQGAVVSSPKSFDVSSGVANLTVGFLLYIGDIAVGEDSLDVQYSVCSDATCGSSTLVSDALPGPIQRREDMAFVFVFSPSSFTQDPSVSNAFNIDFLIQDRDIRETFDVSDGVYPNDISWDVASGNLSNVNVLDASDSSVVVCTVSGSFELGSLSSNFDRPDFIQVPENGDTSERFSGSVSLPDAGAGIICDDGNVLRNGDYQLNGTLAVETQLINIISGALIGDGFADSATADVRSARFTYTRPVEFDLVANDCFPEDRDSFDAEFSGYTPICTETNLTDMRDNPDNRDDDGNIVGNYVLTDNITLTEDWTPIGDADDPFTGHFHGNNFEISNLTVSAEEYAGLFGYINNTEISNLRIVAHSIAAVNSGGAASAGVLAGRSENSEIRDVYVNLSHAEGVPDQLLLSAMATGEYSNASAGGLIGNSTDSTITRSYAYVAGNLMASSRDATTGEIDVKAGGLIGSLERGSVDLSYAVVDKNITVELHVLNEAAINGYVGGLIGDVIGAESTSVDLISRSYAIVGGEVVASVALDTDNTLDHNLASGGLIGRFAGPNGNSEIDNSYTIVDGGVYVRASGLEDTTSLALGSAGGLVGLLEDTLPSNLFRPFIARSYAVVRNISSAHGNLKDAGGITGAIVSGAGFNRLYYYAAEITPDESSDFERSLDALRGERQEPNRSNPFSSGLYVNWSSLTWDFGSNGDGRLPDLIGLPPCPTAVAAEENCRLTIR